MIKRTECSMKPWSIIHCRFYRPDGCEKNCYYNTIEVKSNADGIRSMSDKKLALFIEKCIKGFIEPTKCNTNCLREDCYDCWLEWLKMEMKGDI